MSIRESLMVALFSITLVFFVLAVLCAVVMVLSRAIGIKVKKKTSVEKPDAFVAPVKLDWDVEAVHASSGELKLKNVDEKTAAMIMAIVSDESQIPLSELIFKSIAAVD